MAILTLADNVMVMCGLSGDMDTTLLCTMPLEASSVRGNLYEPNEPPAKNVANTKTNLNQSIVLVQTLFKRSEQSDQMLE